MSMTVSVSRRWPISKVRTRCCCRVRDGLGWLAETSLKVARGRSVDEARERISDGESHGYFALRRVICVCFGRVLELRVSISTWVVVIVGRLSRRFVYLIVELRYWLSVNCARGREVCWILLWPRSEPRWRDSREWPRVSRELCGRVLCAAVTCGINEIVFAITKTSFILELV